MKRVWPRARGRRDILLKRMSHISVVVEELGNMGE
jgi:large subunit ribosomal protein L22